MRVAVTGATGFIGRELLRLLIEHGDDVRILSRRPFADLRISGDVRVYEADLTKSDHRTMCAFVDGVDVLYHAAGQLTRESDMHSVQVQGTRRLIEAASGRIGRWVQLSSVGVYGPMRDGIVTEDAALNPIGTYELTKFQSDELLERCDQVNDFEYSILRPSNVFGPDMTNRSLFQLIHSIDRRLFIFIGRPGASANYITVENVADALLLCGTMPEAKGRTYNISDHRLQEPFIAAIAAGLGVDCPRLRMAERTAHQLSKLSRILPSFPLTSTRVDALVNRCVYQIGRIERELGYCHRVSMEEAIENLVRRWKCQRGRRSAWWFRALS
jgi:nucleoside-diphosphate-sugar epimerase